jgi:prepilin-type N-terminal cleavage/methylation domain-containing protein
MTGRRPARRGFTLIEVLLATVLLSLAGIMLLTASSRCLGVIKRGKQFQTAQWVLSTAEAENYADPEAEDPDDWEVARVSFQDDFDFERSRLDVEFEGFPQDVDPEELVVMHPRVSWSEGARDASEDLVRILCPNPP